MRILHVVELPKPKIVGKKAKEGIKGSQNTKKDVCK